MGNLLEERTEDILEMICRDVSRELKNLLKYGKETAGGIMDLEFVAVSENKTVGNVVTIIREKNKR